MKECRLQRRVAQRRGPEFIPVRGVSSHLFQAEIFVLTRPVENYVALPEPEYGSDLWNPDVVVLEIAEHFVGLASHLVTRNTSALAEENQGAELLIRTHRLIVAAGVAVDRRVGEHHREF